MKEKLTSRATEDITDHEIGMHLIKRALDVIEGKEHMRKTLISTHHHSTHERKKWKQNNTGNYQKSKEKLR